MKNGPPDGEKRYLFYEWYVVVVCMIAYVFSFIDRQILALLIEPIRADLAISDTGFSLLQGLAFSLFYAAMGLPIARLADKRSRPHIIAAGIFLWSVMTAACGIARNFWDFFLARMAVGIGEASLSPATYSMLSDYFPRHKLGWALGVYSIGSFVGGGLAFLIGAAVIDAIEGIGAITLPMIGETRPWQITFFIVGLPGALVALLVFLTIRDPGRKGLMITRDDNGRARAAQVSFSEVIAFIRRHGMTFFTLYLGFSFSAVALFGIMSWTPAIYIRVFSLSAGEVGYRVGIIVLLANTSGVLTSGFLADWFTRRGYTDAGMRVGMIGGIGLALPAALFPLVDNLSLSFVLLTFAMFFASFPLATSAMAMQVLAPNQMRAQVSAIFLFISNLLGLAVGTTVIALITDYVFKDDYAVGYSVSIVCSVAALGLAGFLGAGLKHFRRSLDAGEELC